MSPLPAFISVETSPGWKGIMVKPSCVSNSVSMTSVVKQENIATNPLELVAQLDKPLVDSSLTNRVCQTRKKRISGRVGCDNERGLSSRTSSGSRCVGGEGFSESDSNAAEKAGKREDLLLATFPQERQESQSGVGDSEEVGLEVVKQVFGGAVVRKPRQR